ncbi:protein LAZ1 homolog 2 isoform X1 [Elaeis guineensis]|uniref:Protein LAZ1 homolog 2 isoform X1 n=1 Tax=Elaeis guineensis var. tenera TaxID=51953 RepID=A0A6I9SCU9_ELAGV|nr:protein LAZ1 homolog 2 isoform X1 [Elaeis guineensis]
MELNHLSNFGGVYKNLHIPALVIGGVSVLIALVLSFLLILQHLRSYTNPAEQKWIIGIIFMVPVYATESIISLWNSRFSIICDILRNCYEAFALYSFGSYLAACLGGEERVAELLENGANKQLSEQLLKEEEKERAPHRRSFLDFFCHPSVLGKYLYTIVKFGLVQYMILKTLCAFLALLLELFGVYGDGEFQLYYGYPYIAVVLNFSQMWALYCLVQFYNVTHHRLQAIKPLAKFISFKAIVFATWWQGVGIAIICYFGILPKEGKIQNGIQDFLICIEMAIAAVAHVYVFSAKPYRFLSVSEYGKVTSLETTTKVKINESGKGRPTSVEQEETRVESPGTSITKSVQDVVLGSGEHVVKDVALTISQAIEPVEKGVTKIQETFHHISFGSDKEKEHKVEVDEYITENVVGDDPHIISSKMEINNGNLQ